MDYIHPEKREQLVNYNQYKKESLLVSNKIEVNNLLKGINHNDFILNLISLSQDTFYFYTMLDKYSIKYASVALGIIPNDRTKYSFKAIKIKDSIEMLRADLFEAIPAINKLIKK